jgi:acyl-CoA thioesterase I
MMKFPLVLLSSTFFLQTLHAQQPADPCESLKREREAMESQLRDWPNLARYREANARLAMPAEGESRVVFLGDSITQAWDLSVFFRGKSYVNRGISGQTTPQILLRLRQDVLALKPEIVVILAGTNDLAENTGPTTLGMIEDNLKSMAELARENGVRPVLASVLPAAVYPWKPEIRPISEILMLNQWMKEYAAKEGIVYLDYYSALTNDQHGIKAEFSGDGVHPNAAGYSIMAPLVEDAIAKSKPQPPKKSP